MRSHDRKRRYGAMGAVWFAAAGLAQASPADVTRPGSAPAPGDPAERSEPHHAAVDIAHYPWSSVGKLFNSVGGACTAAVIAPDRILTAAHCLYAFRTGRFLRAEAIHFLLGYERGDYSLHVRIGRIGIGPGYDPAEEARTAASDWAVLTLAEPLPADIRPLAVAEAVPATGSAIAVGGFAQDRAHLMTADTHCHVEGLVDDGRLLSHDCVVRHGDSGAPLLLAGRDGTVQAFAVTVGFLKTADRQVSIAAPITAAILATAQRPP